MRKKEREILDPLVIEAIIRSSLVCRLAFVDGHRPYLVPVCFGYRQRTLYFHGALQGKKMDLIRAGSPVCFEFESEVVPKPDPEACNWSMRYRSVIGFGRAVIIEDIEEKRTALNIIMAQYAHDQYSISEKSLKGTAVVKIIIEEMRGKQSGS